MQDNEKLDAILNRIKSTFDVNFEIMEVDNQKLELLQIANMKKYLDNLLLTKKIRNPLKDLPLWAKIWPGSLVLGRFLRRFQKEDQSLLEIGAGMGATSLIASSLGFKNILATDANDQAIDFIEANILKNNLSASMRVQKLDISNDETGEKFDLIAASELLYLDNLHRPLIKFIDRRLAPGGKAVFCTDIARLKPRFAKLARQKFDVEEGHVGLKASDGERHIYNMLIVGKK